MYIESREVIQTAILMIINLKIQRQGQGQDSSDKDVELRPDALVG
jgi:hypothetical protein